MNEMLRPVQKKGQKRLRIAIFSAIILVPLLIIISIFAYNRLFFNEEKILQRVDVLSKNGKYEESNKQLAKIPKKLRDSFFYSVRAYNYNQLEEYNKALKDATMAIAGETSSGYYTLRGEIYYNMKIYPKSIDDFTEAIKLEPNGFRYVLRGDVYYAMRSYGKALKDFSSAIKLEKHHSYFASRGDAYYAIGAYKLALLDYSEAIKMERDDYYFVSRGDVYSDMTLYKEAVKEYMEAIKINPSIPVYYYDVSCAYSLMKNKEKSMQFLEKALAVGFNDLDHLKNDKSLNYIKNTEQFTKLIKKAESMKTNSVPSPGSKKL
ncbi:MAG: hypothetical protein GY754_24705 [bacterium]|nr:hypothetical protein [bacterium]